MTLQLLFFIVYYKQIYTFLMEEQKNIYPRIIMGLDVSTACIGVSVVMDNGDEKPKILKLTHISPKVSKKIKGIEALFLRKEIFEKEFISEITGYGITDVVIEEPLLSSNNKNTVATLLRFNGMIAESIYRLLGIVPSFISSYDARMYSFPELVSLRKFNKKGVEYPEKHIDNAIKGGNIVLFGSYPFDVDKKVVMMNMVNDNFTDIEWLYNAKGELKKENYDACDSLICALAFININHHGIDTVKIAKWSKTRGDKIEYDYTTQIWGIEYEKKLVLNPITEENV